MPLEDFNWCHILLENHAKFACLGIWIKRCNKATLSLTILKMQSEHSVNSRIRLTQISVFWGYYLVIYFLSDYQLARPEHTLNF